MSDSSQVPFVRPDAIPVNVYNDGLCVYLFDESAEAELSRMIDSGDYPETGLNENLHQNLQCAGFAREVAAKGLALVYELQQDDPIIVEVGVGKALSKTELGRGYWMKAQTGYLHLPTGQLRVDCPNSLRIGNEQPTDEGGVVEVPPGHYKVTLYRTDWDAVERAEIEDYEGPDEFILLTPLKEPPAKTTKTPILPFVPPIDPEGWRDAFSVDGKNFTAQVNSSYWWTALKCNLDREAVAQLGLEPGSIFELKVFNLNFVALYLGDVEYHGVVKSVGEERFKTLMAKYPEFAVAHWDNWITYDHNENGKIEKRETFLTLQRPDGQKPYPGKGHGIWVDATGRVLDDKSP